MCIMLVLLFVPHLGFAQSGFSVEIGASTFYPSATAETAPV